MRQEINPGAFADLMPKGSKIYMQPQLPTIEYKKNGINYKIADLTLLNPAGVDVFLKIMESAANDGETKEVSFKVDPKTQKKTIEIIEDIVMGVSYSARKRGRDGWSTDGHYLVTGCKTMTTENEKIIIFKLNQSAVHSLANYAKSKPEVNLYEAIEQYIDDTNREMKEALETMMQQEDDGK